MKILEDLKKNIKLLTDNSSSYFTARYIVGELMRHSKNSPNDYEFGREIRNFLYDLEDKFK